MSGVRLVLNGQSPLSKLWGGGPLIDLLRGQGYESLYGAEADRMRSAQFTAAGAPTNFRQIFFGALSSRQALFWRSWIQIDKTDMIITPKGLIA